MFLAVSNIVNSIHVMASDVTRDWPQQPLFHASLTLCLYVCVCAGDSVLLAAILCAHALPDV